MKKASIGGLVLVVTLAAGSLAWARPGGGQSYSGSSSSGGGGFSSSSSSGSGSSWGGGGGSWSRSSGSSSYSGGGGGDVDGGWPMAVILVIVILAFSFAKIAEAAQRVSAQSSRHLDLGTFHAAAPVTRPALPDLGELRAADPDFSTVLFEDFVFALYARAQHARSSPAELAQLAPYLEPDARAALASRAMPGWRVAGVVVGAMRVVRVRQLAESTDGAPAGTWVRVAFETNLSQQATDGRRATQYVVEEWVLHRAPGVLTRPWKGARSFDCPNCGASATQLTGNRCAFCDAVFEGGRFDWSVHTIQVRGSEDRPPALTGTVEEVGTDEPTVFHPQVQSGLAGLLADDPALSVQALGARLQLIYTELNRGWNADHIGVIRPLVSDGLCAYLQYWLDAYRAQGLRNVLSDAVLTNWTIARVTRDRHYDAVTVRLWAHGLDYTLTTPEGKLVGGDQTRPRAYSEYWTLIRGAAVRGAPRADRACPSCGAELAAGMGGACSHCDVVITRGDFDWVLSKIEQDESYSG